MAQIISMCASSSVPREAAVMFHLLYFGTGMIQAGFPIHSFLTFERIKKYDENEEAWNVGKPYSIEVGGMERTIIIYGIASTRFDIAG
ncbi:MAG: hypothetical protein HFI69_04640 [Lachnospiraceae bacterium]|nr:hypothetical protein [Lachnospiraceae bacterium]